MNINELWSSFSKVITQTPPIGGLEITREAMRFVYINGKELKFASLRLPPEMIGEKGIKNPAQFEQALMVLMKQVRATTGLKRSVGVVVSLPFSNTYIQAFKLPLVADKDIEEAAELNMQMISPIPITSAYYDFEKIENNSNDGQMEFLGAFAPAIEVDSFVEPLKRAGFIVVAVEFASLALTRLSSSEDIINEKEIKNGVKDHLLMAAGVKGIDFMVVRGGRLFFNYFVSWVAMGVAGENEFTVPALTVGMEKSLRQVMNFYSGRWGGFLDEIEIIAPGNYKIMEQAVQQAKMSLKIKPLTVPKWPQLDPRWLVSLGLALRGVMTRSKDSLLSLAKVGTEDKFRNEQIIAFSKFWQNIIVSSLGFLIVIFGMSNFFLTRTVAGIEIERQLSGSSVQLKSIEQEVDKLTIKGSEFNKVVDGVALSFDQRYSWAPFLTKITTLAGSRIRLNRIYFQSPRVPVIISGVAEGEKDVLDFKARLEKDNDLEDVKLPLSDTSRTGNQLSFSLSFLVKNLPAEE